jgi:cellulose synthase/poly-beta-1,6-N-acetylglucosamine synthase-like glycosyltransferase
MPPVEPAGRSVSIVVPSYRRPEALARCLPSLVHQLTDGDEVLVVRRCNDLATAAVIAESTCATLVEVEVDRPGQIAAILAGIQRSRHDVVAFTDDDAVPRADWLSRLRRSLEDPDVGGVGGRDIVHDPASEQEVLREEVGRISHWGKQIGNHHLGTGPPRPVALLKGANMAFRRAALAIPTGLRGVGAQVHQEVSMCLWASKRGWTILYDPAIVVDHYPAERLDPDRRGRPEAKAVSDAAYNYTFSLLSFQPQLFWRRTLYGLLVGDRAIPGLARAVVAVARREADVIRYLPASLIGQAEALVDIARGRRLSMITFGDQEFARPEL